ncbi:ATP-binding protein [Bordetella genomosp. 13]|uniref:histidine kinase n=1 Tax=Bordetella genomosp. 13 TaxID=463040 RepID=A0A1W6ZBH9_9BORD|nr:ATP-binding protein [Bordetella genomosp. 13]ARP94733.1 hypothetical protein CAL15_10245 [Bordetella genomosp. 13]
MSRCRQRNSLKRRMLLALLVTVLLNWVTWLALQAREMGSQQTGSWDGNLQDVAQKALLSLPGPMPPSSRSNGYHLPDNAIPKEDGLALQAWQLRGGQPELVLRSPEAPHTPMTQDFGRLGFSDVTINGEPWRVYALNDRDVRIQVQVGRPISHRRAEFNRWLAESLKATAILLGLLCLSVFCVLRRGLRSIDNMRALMQQRDPFDLTPLPVQDIPLELQPLVESVNRLLERLETAMTRERRLIADAAHELRTPLAVVTTQAELAHSAALAEDKNEALDKLMHAARRATRLSEQLLDQARLDALERAPTEPVNLAALVAMVVHDHESAARAKRQRIRLDVQTCSTRGDLDALGILVGNLVDNALRYTPEDGRIDVTCAPGPDGGAILCVADNGPGVPEEECERIFQRFYRAQGNSQRGSGIGLSLVAQIAQLHGARVECGPGADGIGFRIQVMFAPPAAGPARKEADAAA